MRQAARFAGHARLSSLLAALLLGGAATYLTAVQPATGALEGIVKAEESGAPIAEAAVRLVPVGPDAASRRVHVARSGPDGTFRLGNVPIGKYALSVTGKMRELRRADIEVGEGPPQRATLLLPIQAPDMSLIVHQHMFTPDEQVEVAAKGFVLDGALRVQCFRIDPAHHAASGRHNIWGYLDVPWQEGIAGRVDLASRPYLAPLPPEEHPVTTRDAEGVFYQRIHPRVSEPGLYLVSVRGDDLQRVDWFVITRLGLVVKHAGREALVFAADLKTGAPAAGCEVRVTDGDKLLAEGATDADGLARFRLAGDEIGSGIAVTGRWGASFASTSLWMYDDEESGPHRVYAYTDRPVYRPGDTVQFKAVARRLAGDDYEVVAGKQARVEVRDEQGNLMHAAEPTTNARGSLWGEFRLPAQAPGGEYELITLLDDRPHRAAFDVASYRKPEYEVSVATDKPWYVRGETMQVTVEARHYFGAPVADARVSYLVRRVPAWDDYYADEEDLYEDMEMGDAYDFGYGEMVAEGETTADASGRVTIPIDTRLDGHARGRSRAAGDREDMSDEHDHWYTIECDVSDPARRHVSGSATVRVARGEFALTMQPDRWVLAPDETARLTITARDHDKRPQAGLEVQVAAGPHHWTENRPHHEVLLRERLVTDEQGRAELAVTPAEPGSYLVRVSAADARGNVVVAREYLWVVEEGVGWYDYKYPELELVPDKPLYEEGETARVLVNAEKPAERALVTLEGGRIFDARLARLDGPSTILEIPIRAAYVPNVYVSVSYIRDKEFVTRTKRLSVSSAQRALNLSVTPSKETFAPGEDISYEVRATDAAGRPVEAELSLAVVNEAVFAVRPERKPDILDFFYPRRYNRVETSFSFPQIYLSPGDKGSWPQEVREKFRDTAFWAPALLTDASGRATVEFKLPDDLTTWRATALAHTPHTTVGTGRAKVITRKELMVRLAAPRFFTEKDRATIAAIVHNESGEAQRVTVHLDPEGLGRMTSPAVTILAGGRHVYEREITVASARPLRILAWARAESGLEDAMRMTLPVTPHGRRRVECRAGTTREQVRETLELHQNAVASAGGLVINLAPSLASSLLGALPYLATYPYGCTEQILSAFLPDVVIHRALRELGIRHAALEERLPDMVQNGLLRLYQQQRHDGAWGWWRDDAANPWMTAYALYGLLEARRAGFEVRPEALRRGLDALQQMPADGGAGPDGPAFARYVLALGGRHSTARAALVRHTAARAAPSTDYALALHAMTLDLLGETEEALRELDRLWGRSRASRGLRHWGEPDTTWHARGNATETTALALLATCRLRPDDARTGEIVRWLMLRRQGNRWYSTRDTAMVLYALVEYLKLTDELQPDYTARVTVNGKHLDPVRMTREMTMRPQVEVVVPRDELSAGANVVELSVEGSGTLHYSLELTQWIREQDAPAVASEAGISIERSYHKLVPTEGREPGVIEYKPGPAPVEAVRSGETIRCMLTIKTDRPLEHVILEDPLPAGCEPLPLPQPWEYWDYWWDDEDARMSVSATDLRDDQVSLFWTRLDAGTHKFHYDLRAALPGEYHIMAPTAYNMYEPAVRGLGTAGRLVVR